MEFVIGLLEQIVHLVNEMSPYLLLGFLIAGVMHAFIPEGWYARFLSGDTLRSVVNAAIFGVPLPLCSCGVIPTAMSLRREGASKGAVVSFLIATPQTGVDSIFATYSLMGLPFALVRPAAAFLTALLGGVFVNMDAPKGTEAGGSCGVTSQVREAADQRTGSAVHAPRGFWGRCVDALRFGFVEMMEDIGRWLMVGLIVAGLITVAVPDSFFAVFKDNTLLSMLLVLGISIPMYLCATGSIPIAVALMMKGLTPGAALMLLMAGPACNVASILVISKVLGKRTLVLYLAAIISGAVSAGFFIDYLLPREWFTAHLTMNHACSYGAGASWFEWVCTGVLVLLLLNVLRRRLMHKHACGCGHHHEGGDCCCHGHESVCSCGEETEKVRTYVVKGMSCNHCKSNVEKVVNKVEGVKAASVDLQSGVLEVAGDEVDDAEVCSAVESIGFDIEKK